MNTQELVAKALVPVREFLTSTEPIVPEDWEDSPKERYRHSNEELDHSKIVRLRFDYELDAYGEVPAWDKDSISRLMVAAIEGDLLDVIENGDRDGNDPLWKVFDGRKKTGKNPTDVRVDEMVVYREYKPKKGAYEYTMFMLLTVEWE
jgi:hypothetical protein